MKCWGCSAQPAKPNAAAAETKAKPRRHADGENDDGDNDDDENADCDNADCDKGCSEKTAKTRARNGAALSMKRDRNSKRAMHIPRFIVHPCPSVGPEGRGSGLSQSACQSLKEQDHGKLKSNPSRRRKGPRKFGKNAAKTLSPASSLKHKPQKYHSIISFDGKSWNAADRRIARHAPARSDRTEALMHEAPHSI